MREIVDVSDYELGDKLYPVRIFHCTLAGLRTAYLTVMGQLLRIKTILPRNGHILQHIHSFNVGVNNSSETSKNYMYTNMDNKLQESGCNT